MKSRAAWTFINCVGEKMLSERQNPKRNLERLGGKLRGLYGDYAVVAWYFTMICEVRTFCCPLYLYMN